MALPTWVTREEAKRILDVASDKHITEILKKHRVPRVAGPGNKSMYSRAKLLQVARIRVQKAAQQAQAKELSQMAAEVVAETKAGTAKKAAALKNLVPTVSDIVGAGQITARAFKLFEEQFNAKGVIDFVAVVIELEITAEEVTDLYASWKALKQSTQDWLDGRTQSTPSPPPAAVAQPVLVDVPPVVEPLPPQPMPPISRSAVACAGEKPDGTCCPKHFFARRKTAANG